MGRQHRTANVAEKSGQLLASPPPRMNEMKFSDLFSGVSQDEPDSAPSAPSHPLSLLPFYGLLVIACILAMLS